MALASSKCRDLDFNRSHRHPDRTEPGSAQNSQSELPPSAATRLNRASVGPTAHLEHEKASQQECHRTVRSSALLARSGSVPEQVKAAGLKVLASGRRSRGDKRWKRKMEPSFSAAAHASSSSFSLFTYLKGQIS